MRYVVYDLEWNSPDSERRMIINNTLLSGEIIQIGAVMLDEYFDEIDSFNVMIAPKYYTNISAHVQAITHITQEEMSAGIPFLSAVDSFFKWCGNDYVFCTWGNGDTQVLKENLAVHGRVMELPETVDVQKMFAIQILDEQKSMSLSDAMDVVHESPFEAHDALNDAESTSIIMLYLDFNSDYEDCIVRLCKEYRQDCIRSDKLGSSYLSENAVLTDWSVKCFTAPMTNKKCVCKKWEYSDDGKYISLAGNENGPGFFVSLDIKKRKNGKFLVTRNVFAADDELIRLYEETAERNSRMQLQ